MPNNKVYTKVHLDGIMFEGPEAQISIESTIEKKDDIITKEPDCSGGSSSITLFPELFASGNPTFKRNILSCKQRFNWDCGIACVAMCLRIEDRNDLYHNIEYYQEEFRFNESVWTIDMCYLLKHFGVKFKFATRFAGVDQKYRHFSYYRKSIDQDTVRVLHGFAEAPKNGINVAVSKVYIQTIFQHIYTLGPVIVLVNSNLLRCIDCSSAWTPIIKCCFGRRYQGHYVLVTGFDLRKKLIFYNDPTYGDRTCRTYTSDFEAARTARGTDWDTILVESEIL